MIVKNIKIFSEETIYEKNKDLLYFNGTSKAELENNYIFETENLYFNRQGKEFILTNHQLLKMRMIWFLNLKNLHLT